MMKVGLTGGIGSGKTTVGKMFADLGVPVYNSDLEAKKLMESSEKLKASITELLGEEAYSGKKLNKKYISERVFDNKGLLQKLNAIVHPAVRKHFLSWASQQKTPYVIQEAAILFENGSYKDFDKMILVKAEKRERIARIKDRDGVAVKEILARMKNQWGDEKKSKLTDFTIENSTLEKAKSQVLRIHAQLAEIAGGDKF